MTTAGRFVHPQAREIITNVYLYLQNEKMLFRQNKEKKYFQRLQHRSAKATGISFSTINRILNKADEALQASTSTDTTVTTPIRKNIKPKKTYFLDLTDSQYAFIRRTIYDLQLNSQVELTMERLKDKLIESLVFNMSIGSLKRIVTQLGFYSTHTKDKTKALIEKHDVRLKRLKYLEEIKSYRSVNRNIVYANLSFLELKRTSYEKIRRERRLRHFLIVMYAGTEDGLLPETFSAFEVASNTAEYYNAVSNDLLEKWIRSQLIPKLPTESVLVVDDTPVFNKYVDMPPSISHPKQFMVDWLMKYNVSVDTNLMKPEVYEIILQVKESCAEYLIDKALSEHGHYVLRLPAFHADFNPAHAVWTTLESHVNDQTKFRTKLLEMKQILIEKIDNIGVQEWKKAYEDSIQREKQFTAIEEEIDKFTDILKFESEDCSEFSDGEDSTDDVKMI